MKKVLLLPDHDFIFSSRIATMTCIDHPDYDGKKPPEGHCSTCWDLYDIRHRNRVMNTLIETMSIEKGLEALASNGWAVDLIYDDDGNWAFSDSGFSSIRESKKDGLVTSPFVEGSDFKPSIREAWIHFVRTRDLSRVDFNKKQR